eukprot:1159877-Pelagomonas_calceolata.AAC.11
MQNYQALPIDDLSSSEPLVGCQTFLEVSASAHDTRTGAFQSLAGFLVSFVGAFQIPEPELELPLRPHPWGAPCAWGLCQNTP